MVGVHKCTWSLGIGHCNGCVRFEFMINESVCQLIFQRIFYYIFKFIVMTVIYFSIGNIAVQG